MEKITKQLALKLLLGLFIAVIIFHLLIVFQVIPYTIVWAGKLKTVDEMYAPEPWFVSHEPHAITETMNNPYV